MKIRLLLLGADLVVCFNVALWTGLFTEFSSGVVVLNYILLVLTCLVPAVYILCASRRSLDPALNEALIPSAILTGVFFLGNLIATVLLFCLSKTSYLPTVITECVLVSVYVVLLLVVMAMTSHIRKVNKKNNFKDLQIKVK